MARVPRQHLTAFPNNKLTPGHTVLYYYTAARACVWVAGGPPRIVAAAAADWEKNDNEY